MRVLVTRPGSMAGAVGGGNWLPSGVRGVFSFMKINLSVNRLGRASVSMARGNRRTDGSE
jgi:hypothetical protein